MLLTYARLLPFLAVTLVLAVGLTPALLAGLLVREVALVLEPRFQSFGAKARAAALGVIGLSVVLAFVLGGLAGYRTVMGDGSGEMLAQIVKALLDAKLTLPSWAAAWLPASLVELKQEAAKLLATNGQLLGAVSGGALHSVALVLLGMVVGAMSLFQVPGARPGPLLAAWLDGLGGLADAFSRVVFSQVKISAINTGMTAVLLVVLLPAFDVHLPFIKTLLVITFVFGLVPIVGNIASNVLLFLSGLTHSVEVAALLLGYLILVHSLEHFLNAIIVGKAVRSRAMELLPAMLLGETLFGVGGMVMAPIVYTWVKTDLQRQNLV